MNSIDKQNEIIDIAEKLQTNCHCFIEEIIKKSDKPISYQDATNTWLFHQLAIIKSDINHINRKIAVLNYK